MWMWVDVLGDGRRVKCVLRREKIVERVWLQGWEGV
jgi:hypothetical protein